MSFQLVFDITFEIQGDSFVLRLDEDYVNHPIYQRKLMSHHVFKLRMYNDIPRLP